MTKILTIRSSASGDKSVTNQLVDAYLTAVTAAEPAATIVQRDLDADPIPHLTSETMAGIGRPAPETAATAATRTLSDTLVAELQAADTLVIGLPMYNFGMPSTLKSWFDHVLRAGVTFQYTANGPQGLVTGKHAVIIAARAGAYDDAAADHQIGHVKTLLGFIGITDVEVVLAEGLAYGEEAASKAIAAAHTALGQLVGVPA